MIALIITQVVLQVFEGVQIGRLTSYITNLTKLAGSLFTFVTLLVMPHLWQSMSVFVVAISGGLVFGSLINAAVVSRKVRPRLVHFSQTFRKISHITGSGASFVVISLASLAETQGLVLLLAACRGAGSVIELGLYVRLLLIHFSVIAILTGPLWPALISARGAADHRWIRAAIRRTAVLVLLGGTVSAIVVAAFGRQLLGVWMHSSFPVDPVLQYSMGLFFFQLTWSHFWSILLIGSGDEKFVSKVYTIEIYRSSPYI